MKVKTQFFQVFQIAFRKFSNFDKAHRPLFAEIPKALSPLSQCHKAHLPWYSQAHSWWASWVILFIKEIL